MIENTSVNSLYEDIEIFASEFFSFLKELFDTVVKKSSFPSLFNNESFDSLTATELQITLLKVIFLLLLTSIVLSGICWRKYGEVITDKFIKPSKIFIISKIDCVIHSCFCVDSLRYTKGD